MSDGISLPSAPAQTPGLPENFHPITIEKFEGLNTKPPRPGIADGELFWCDGFMPIGPNHLRVLWGIGPAKFTAEGATVRWFGFGNISDTPYGIVLQSDGAVHEFNTTTGERFQIMPAGTIQNPSSIVGFSQWGSQYLIFGKDQTNGYWLWDGTNLFTAGTVAPEALLTNAGSEYTGPPTITLQTTGSGTGATFTAQIDNGSVAKIKCSTPGSGFAVGDFAALNIQGGGSDDQALAGGLSPTLSSGGVSAIIINNGGQDYTARAFGVFSGGGGSGAVASLGIQNGVVTQVAVVNAGQGYTDPPTFTVNDPGIPGSGGSAVPGGNGFSGFCNVAFGQITTIPISYGGSGYVSPPTLKILGDGVNAAGIVQIAAGQVTGVVLSNFGSGYTRALAVFDGGNNAANADISLMPFGISGTTLEVYQQRVWDANGGAVAEFPPKGRTIFSDPGSPFGFSNGGGAFQSTDSFLRIGYHWLKQTNGFLYLGGDSSLNYISGVQTSASTGTASVATTNFNNINVDPQIGSPWPSSVQVFSRNIVFANSIGVYVSYGGAVTKASLPLDGFYDSGGITSPGSNYPSAVAVIFGIPIYMLLLPIIDQFTGQPVNKLLMWDGKKWFTSPQERELSFIATQEIDSVMTAWGTDGTDIFPLFAQPSTGFTKRVQSKLFASPAYWTTKTAKGLSGIVQSYALDQNLTITIDNEDGQGTGNALKIVPPGAGELLWFNDTGQPISWTNNAGNPLQWGVPGLDVFGPYPIGQVGRLIGLTVETDASDLALLSLNISEMIETVNVA